jgi:hypothetical protein
MVTLCEVYKTRKIKEVKEDIDLAESKIFL